MRDAHPCAPLVNPVTLTTTTTTMTKIAESLPHSYFNTYGGNNLACAMGEAVLDVVLREKLQASDGIDGCGLYCSPSPTSGIWHAHAFFL